MGQLLLHGPIHELEVRVGHGARFLGALRLDRYDEVDVEIVLVIVLEVWEWSGVLGNKYGFVLFLLFTK